MLLAVSPPAGAAWQDLVLPGTSVRGIGLDPWNPDRVFLGTWTKGLYYSLDGGETWSANPSAFIRGDQKVPVFDVLFDPSDPRNGIAITKDGTWRSFTRGITWEIHPAMYESEAPFVGYAMEPIPDGSGVAMTEGLGDFGGGRFFVYHWATGDFTLGTASSQLGSLEGENTLGISFSADGRILFGHTTSIYVTDDFGQTIRRNSAGLPDLYPRALLSDPDVAGVTLAAIDAGIYRQTSIGGAWELFGSGVPSPVRRLIRHPNDGDVLFAATNVGVYRSDDRGATWVTMGIRGMQDTPVITDIDIHPMQPRILYAAAMSNDEQRGGLYRTFIDPLTSVDIAIGADPATRARPNPFGGRTTIEFTLSRPSDVRVEIFDAAGRHVDTLVDERLDAGRHSPRWTGQDDSGRALGSGVYFYRVALDGTTRDRGRLVLRR